MKLIPNDPKKKNALFAAILALAGLYAFHAMWYSGKKEALDTMTARVEQIEDQNRRAQILATRGGRELEEKLAQYERHLLRLEQLIPQSEEVPALLGSMAVEARQHDVELVLMRPEPDEVGPYYTKDLYAVGVTGTYHDVGRYLSAIASLPRIITPSDLDITVFQNSGQQQRLNRQESRNKKDEAMVSAQFRIMTYVIPPASPTPQAPTADEAAAEDGQQ